MNPLQREHADLSRRAAWRPRRRMGFLPHNYHSGASVWIAFAADKAAAIQASRRLTALMDFRHAFIAHNLTLPEPDMKTEATVADICLRRFVSGPG
jgi:hypothetical protein